MPHEIDGQPHWHEPAGDDLAGLAEFPRPASPYDRFMAEEGVPVWRGVGFGGLEALPLAPWRRLGGRGCYVQPFGTEGQLGCYVIELPRGGALLPERHLYEKIMVVAEGRGTTELWLEGAERVMFEWQRGAIFAIPRNAHHRLVNAAAEPATLIGFTTAPGLIDLLGDPAVVFTSRHTFQDRLDAAELQPWDDVEPDPLDGLAVTRTARIDDAIGCDLPLDNRASPGHRRLGLEMTGGRLLASLGQHRQGRYGRALRTRPGGVALTLAGQGETRLWRDGGQAMAIRTGPFGLVSLSPDGDGFHQHFNRLSVPLRHLEVRVAEADGPPGTVMHDLSRVRLAEGGAMIPYWAEDPAIRARHASNLDETGAANRMHAAFYQAP